jgi:hypothetical protein
MLINVDLLDEFGKKKPCLRLVKGTIKITFIMLANIESMHIVVAHHHLITIMLHDHPWTYHTQVQLCSIPKLRTFTIPMTSSWYMCIKNAILLNEKHKNNMK